MRKNRYLYLSSDQPGESYDEDEDEDEHLPPSDPPAYSDDNDDKQQMLLTSEDVPLMDLQAKTLRKSSPSRAQEAQVQANSPEFDTPSKRGMQIRPRSSSLPILGTPFRSTVHAVGLQAPPLAAPNFISGTPRTRNRAKGQIKRRETLAIKKAEKQEAEEKRLDEEREKKALKLHNDEMRKAMYLDEVTDMLEEKLTERGYGFIDLADHIFNPNRKFKFDWRWKSFFAHKSKVRKIFEYWTTSKYPPAVRSMVLDFATSVVAKAVREESRAVTDSKMLQKRKMEVNEEFFLKYSLQDLTNRLREKAPSIFRVLDAFSTTPRQLREMSAAWFRRKNIVRFQSL